jgi:glutamate-1-semialdehyde aminotransferase
VFQRHGGVAQKTDDGFSAAGTFSGNPLTLTTGAATLKYLQENSDIYADMMAKGEFLRNGFNEWNASKGYPFCMTGIGSMFQIHAKADLPSSHGICWARTRMRWLNCSSISG